MQKELFLDANAHTPMSSAATKAFVDFNKSTAASGHPMAPSKPGREAASRLEESRMKIASLLGAERSGQIIFTSTCSQACEWAVDIITWNPALYLGNKSFQRVPIVGMSPVEHPAIRYAARDRIKVQIHNIPIDNNGVIQEFTCEKAICTHVQNEIGIIQPLEKLNTNVLLSDMCQSVGKVSINLKEMPIHIAVFGAHKFGGPASIGFMYLKDPSMWMEFGTGSRYYSDRPGTPDVASVVATAAALEEELMTMPERLEKMKEFQSEIEPRLEELGCEIIAKEANRVPNTTFVKLPSSIAMEVLLDLSKQGIYVGLGSACGSMHTGDSPLMQSLGRVGGAGDFIRISQHGDYGKAEALHFMDKLQNIMKEIK